MYTIKKISKTRQNLQQLERKKKRKASSCNQREHSLRVGFFRREHSLCVQNCMKGRSACLQNSGQILGICGTLLHHTLVECAYYSRKCSVYEERVYTGGNNTTDTNNVYCKHISICLSHEKRRLSDLYQNLKRLREIVI